MQSILSTYSSYNSSYVLNTYSNNHVGRKYGPKNVKDFQMRKSIIVIYNIYIICIYIYIYVHMYIYNFNNRSETQPDISTLTEILLLIFIRELLFVNHTP